MGNLFDWSSRKSVKSLEDLCFWTGIGFFFICALFGFANQSPVCTYISGAAFIVGLVIEILSRLCDKRLEALTAALEDQAASRREREAEQYHEETKSLRREIDDHRSFRTLSPSHRELFKSRLSKYAPQKFQIIQIGFGDEEAMSFAEQIRKTLAECGWSGEVYTGFSASDQPAEIGSGAFIGMELDKMLQGISSGGVWRESEALTELRSVFRDSGIETNRSISMRKLSIVPPPAGTFEIIIGAKPKERFVVQP